MENDVVYYNEREERVLKEGVYNGFNYKIVSYGSHPCCYIEIPKDHLLFNINYDDIELTVNGGLTYSGTDEEGKYWIGWDYAHAGDYYGFFSTEKELGLRNGKKWTIKELFDGVRVAIDEIKEIKKFRVKKYYYSNKESDYR